MQSGSEILQYQGNAGLGLGSNAGIPAIDPKADLDVINKASRDILMLNHENNIKLYDQKIADRNSALTMLAQGEVASGKLSDEDRKVYDKGKGDLEKSFYDMMANGGINNVDAYKSFLDKSSNLSNIATWGQGRDLELTKLMQDRANATLPEDIAALDKHIKDQQAKPFWSSIDPFQKAFDFNLPTMQASIKGMPISDSGIANQSTGMGTPATTKTVRTDKKGAVSTSVSTKTPATTATGAIKNTGKNPLTITNSGMNPDGTLSPITFTPETYYDLGAFAKKANEDYTADPTQAENQRQWIKKVSDYNEQGKKELIDSYNRKLAQYSQERGIAPISMNGGIPVYDAQIKTFTAPDGTLQMDESPSTFAAKSTLASIDGGYVQKPQAEFNDKIGAYNVAMKKANTDSFYKHAMANNAAKKTQGYLDNIHQQMKLRGKDAEKDSFLDDLYTKNAKIQNLVGYGTGGEGGGLIKIGGTKSNNLEMQNVPVGNSTPMFYFDGKTFKKLNGIGGETESKLINGKSQKVTTGGYYQPEIVFEGKPLSNQELDGMFKTFKSNAGKKFEGGTVQDFINIYIDKKAFEVNFKGTDEKGNPVTTSKEISNAALRAMTTKKGSTSVFNDDSVPMDDNIPDE